MSTPKHPVDVSFGAAIRAQREESGVSQMELASKLGYAQSAIAKWERGDVPMRLRDAVAVCEFLGVQLSDVWNTPTQVRDQYRLGIQRGIDISRQALEKLTA